MFSYSFLYKKKKKKKQQFCLSRLRRPSCEVRSERCPAECCSECCRRLRSLRKPQCRFEWDLLSIQINLIHFISFHLFSILFNSFQCSSMLFNSFQFFLFLLILNSFRLGHHLRSSALLGHLSPKQQVEVLEYSRTRCFGRVEVVFPSKSREKGWLLLEDELLGDLVKALR